MKRSLQKFILGITLCVVAVTILYAQSSTRGTWTAEYRSDDAGRVHLQMQRTMKHSNMGTEYKLSDLRGLEQSALTGANVPVKFDLVRDAGTINFTDSRVRADRARLADRGTAPDACPPPARRDARHRSG